MAVKNSQIIKLEIPSSMDFVYLLDAVITEILQQMGSRVSETSTLARSYTPKNLWTLTFNLNSV